MRAESAENLSLSKYPLCPARPDVVQRVKYRPRQDVQSPVAVVGVGFRSIQGGGCRSRRRREAGRSEQHLPQSQWRIGYVDDLDPGSVADHPGIERRTEGKIGIAEDDVIGRAQGFALQLPQLVEEWVHAAVARHDWALHAEAAQQVDLLLAGAFHRVNDQILRRLPATAYKRQGPEQRLVLELSRRVHHAGILDRHACPPGEAPYVS